MAKGNHQLNGVRRQLVWLGAAVGGCLVAGSAHAQSVVSPVGWYKLGESDSGAFPGNDFNNPTTDSSGSFHLATSGTPKYSSDVSPLAFGSTLSGNFDGTANLARGGPVTAATANVAMEAWVKTTVEDPGIDPVVVALNGNGGNGYGFLQYHNKWSFIEGGRSFNLSGTVSVGAWTHLAMTIDSGGVLRGYINGVDVLVNHPATAATLPIEPTANFSIGGGFAGKIDQVRVMTYTDNFDLTNLLYGTGVTTVGYRNSFEAADNGSYFLDTADATDGTSAHAGVATDASGYGPQATKGTQFLTFNGGSQDGNAYMLSKRFITGTAEGTIKFDFGNWSGNSSPTQQLRIELLDAATGLPYWSTVVSDSVATQIGAMTPYEFDYTSLADVSILRITDLSTSTPSSDAMIDNIVVTAPEPGAAVLLAAAAAILPAPRRRRR